MMYSAKNMLKGSISGSGSTNGTVDSVILCISTFASGHGPDILDIELHLFVSMFCMFGPFLAFRCIYVFLCRALFVSGLGPDI